MKNANESQFTADELYYVFIVLYQGGKYSFRVPFELKGQGIKPHPMVCNEGWHSYEATTRAFRRLYNQHEIIKQSFNARLDYGWGGTLEDLFNDR
jgi:hypothetical protein